MSSQNTHPKPEWLLHINDFDSGIVEALIDAGADLKKKREVAHFLFDVDKSGVTSVERACNAAGWSTTHEPMFDKPELFCVIAKKESILNDEFVKNSRTFFEKISKDFRCLYDGWEASL